MQAGLTDADKKTLLSQMTFSVEHGCDLLHRFTADGKVQVWFGNEDFARLIQKSLYDITCPGWCGVLDEIKFKPPDAGKVTVCQMTQVSTYTIASQIAWVSDMIILHLIADPVLARACCTILFRNNASAPDYL